MQQKVITGLEKLLKSNKHMQQKGHIALLANEASVDSQFTHAATHLKKIFGERFTTIFSPQHGFLSDLQDNMKESPHFMHPFFQVKVWSLYSETRSPTEEMLKDIDVIFVDLQDIGTRIYTYMYTMTLLMKECKQRDIKIIVLDRPNPLGGNILEGNVLEMQWSSFVGLHPMPTRHGMTMGEIATMAAKYWDCHCQLEIIKMEHWQRDMYWDQTGLPFIIQSPNMPNFDTTLIFPGSVLLEGTELSEGRGTSLPLRLIGHPLFDPYKNQKKIQERFEQFELQGFQLRPYHFQPTHQKQAFKTCGGFEIHVTHREDFKPWQTFMILISEFYQILGTDFQWRQDEYEYEFGKNAFDVINGSAKPRELIEQQNLTDEYFFDCQKQCQKFNELKKTIELY